MNMLISSLIFSLLLIPLIVLGVILLNRSVKHRKTFFNNQRIRWIVSGYMVILLGSVVLSLLIPTPQQANGEIIQIEDIDQEAQQFYEAVNEGRIDKIDRNYINKEWKLDYTGHQLHIKAEGDEYPDIWIVAQRKETNDDTIDIASYQMRSVIGEKDFAIDFTDQIKPISLYLTENTLLLTKPERLDINYAKFTKEFTITQFTKESWIDQRSSSIWGQRLLYLRIPKDLELIEGDNIDIQFVGD